MSPLEILPAQHPADFTLSRSPVTRSDDFPRYNETSSWSDTGSLVYPNDVPHLHGIVEPRLHDTVQLFPSLPPLLNGHKEVHLRNGIMNSSSLAAASEPDPERAFFVADLSEVYSQFLRWKACLPEIQPFYG